METSNGNPRRRALFVAVSSICHEAGFETVEKATIETLTEMLQSFIVELGRSSQAFCELAGRTEPVIADVILTLIDMGISVSSLEAHAKCPNRNSLTAPGQSVQPKQTNILQAGQKKIHPCYIPDYLPAFPDPHSYIRTPTHKQPVTEYEAIREKAASQKRDVERALTRFIAKTGDTQSLFHIEDTNMFPLIATKPTSHAYLDALLPKDQLFEEEYFDPRSRKTEPKQEGEEAEQNKDKLNESVSEYESIDNPYLRPVKLPRKKRR